jgi:hypothetical protein
VPPKIFEHNFASPVAREIGFERFFVAIKQHAQGNAAHGPPATDAPADIVNLAPQANGSY